MCAAYNAQGGGVWLGCGAASAAPSLWPGGADAGALTPLRLPAGGPWGVHPAGRRTLLLRAGGTLLLCAGPLFGEDGAPAPEALPPLRALPPPPAAVEALACGWEHALLLCAGGALPWARAHAAMCAHESQYVAHRRLWVALSCYTFVNVLDAVC